LKQKIEKMESTVASLEGTVFLAGSRITLSALVAICEAYARENYSLFSLLISIAGDAKPNEISDYVPVLRDVIRGYIPECPPPPPSSASVASISSSTKNSPGQVLSPPQSDDFFPFPPPPPFSSSSISNKTPSQIDYELACQIVDEEEKLLHQARLEAEQRDHLEAEKLAQFLEAEYQASITYFHCQICLEQHPVHGSYTLDCSHRFCEECLSGYICSKINSNEVNDDVMICPLSECAFPIPHTIIRGCTKELQNEEAYEKYCEFKKDTFLETELQKGCLLRCPTELCNYCFYYPLNSSIPLPFTCESCLQSYCIKCRVIHHPALLAATATTATTVGTTNTAGAGASATAGGGTSTHATGGGGGGGGGATHFGPGHTPYSCEQQIEKLLHDVEQRKKLEEWRVLNANGQKLFEEAIRSKGWKQCPKCNIYIERNEGCDHMTCRNCKCNFCYVCGKYDRNNPTSRGDCGSSCSMK
jgi:hypothetical protein